MSSLNLHIQLSVMSVLFCVTIVATQGEPKAKPLRYCSFFNNRAPKAQPGLKNCTWFKEESCCLQQEIAATFGRVKPLKGASPGCQKYINYLMCYICAPNQNLFYEHERLTVCKGFCNNLFDACGSAILKGSVIRDLYSSGEEFCRSRRFLVDTENCFEFDDLDAGMSSGASPSYNPLLILLSLVFMCGPHLESFLHGCICQWPKIPSQAINRRRCGKGAHHQCSGNARLVPLSEVGDGSSSIERRSIERRVPVMANLHNTISFSGSPSAILAVALIAINTVLVSGGQKATHQAGSAPRLNMETVQDWALLISNELTQFAKDGLQYQELQTFYDEAEYVTEYINGTDKLQQVREKLANFFSTKRALGARLARRVQKLYDTWKMSSPSHDSYTHVKQLPPSVYRDADLPHTLSNLKYNRRMLSEDHSVIKLPDEVNRRSGAVIDTIQWTAGLDQVFKEIRAEDPSIRWQYFSSTTGVHRVYPGHEWVRNFIGFHKDYDPRTRPWYVSTTSGPKNVIVIIDGSTTMAQGQSLRRAKQIALNVLNTLSKQDRVNVLVSKSSFWKKNGDRVDRSTTVLSCVKKQLLSASTTHKQELAAAIREEIIPDGGSNHEEAFHKAFNLLASVKEEYGDGCQNVVVFITSGVYDDIEQRCSPGYYRFDEQNRKHFKPGIQCYHDFGIIVNLVPKLQYKLSKQAHMFTFVTSKSNKQISPPGRLACDNNGAMARVTNNSEIFRQMAPYFKFLESSSGAEEMVWSSPYRDKLGQGLMITLAVSVHSNVTHQHIGVIGLDIPLGVLEEVVNHYLWGNVYSFVIDSEDDTAVIHPFTKPLAQMINEPALIPVTELETTEGKPGKFSKVLSAMQEQTTGTLLIREGAQRAVPLQDLLTWRPVEYTHYVYTDIPGSDFSIAYNMLQSDEVYQHALEPSGPTPVTYLDDMEMYANLTKSLSNAYSSLSPTRFHPAYPGMSVSLDHSVVKLAPRAFCAYPHNLTFSELHNYINTDTSTPDSQCPKGILHPDVRPDIKLSSRLEGYWTKRHEEIRDKVLWTYLGTISGVMRVYPGLHLPQDYDPTRREWYKQAQVHRGTLVLSTVYLEPDVKEKVVTLSRAIHKAKPLTPPDCTVERRDYGCPCELNHQCKSDYCQDTSCADDIIQGVVAMDIHYYTLSDLVKRVVMQHSPHNYCGHKYGCAENPVVVCETRCHLIDKNMNLVVHPDFDTVPREYEKEYTGVPLASKYGYVSGLLLKDGFFTSHTRVDYQGTCYNAYNDEDLYSFDEDEEPSNSHACIKEVTYYLANLTHIRNTTHSSGHLGGDACSWGRYYFSSVPDTNLYLLVIDNYRDLSAPWNINCRIQNSLWLPGEEKVSHSRCDWSRPNLHDHIHHRRRTCPAPRDVPLSCGYSRASTPSSPHILPCLVISYILYLTNLDSVS